MATSKIAVSIDKKILEKLDFLVKSNAFPSRSRAVQEAVKEKLERIEKTRLARECAKLNQEFEQKMADEDLEMEIDQWPEY